MSWATFWSWTCWTASWCFFIAAVVFVIQWWIRFKMHEAKLRFLESKIDALLDEFDVDFDGRLRKQLSTILHEEGKKVAMLSYIAITGATASEAESYVEQLIDEERATEGGDPEDDGPEDDDSSGGSAADRSKGTRLDAAGDVLDVANLHKMLDDVVAKTFRDQPRQQRGRRRR
jgi:hypothetical protein